MFICPFQVGWTPVLMAMLIASGGGFVLEMAVEHFKGVTLFGEIDEWSIIFH